MNISLLPQVLQDLICEFNVEHRDQMRMVLYEMLKYHLNNKFCMNCDYNYADIKYTRHVETYIFCSESCQWEFEYDIRKYRKYHIIS